MTTQQYSGSVQFYNNPTAFSYNAGNSKDNGNANTKNHTMDNLIIEKYLTEMAILMWRNPMNDGVILSKII